MNHPRLFSVLFLLVASVCLFAEDPPPRREVTHGGGGMMQGFRRQALVIDIEAKVIDQQKEIIWNETHHKLAIPGSPVGVKMVGSNVVVTVQFTPFVRRHGQNVLVAQGQIWVNDSEKGMSYYTSIQTIPLKLGEPIYFFPLGSSSAVKDDYSLEMMITVSSNSREGSRAGKTRESSTENEESPAENAEDVK